MFVFLIPMFLICVLVVLGLSLGLANAAAEGDRMLKRSEDDWMLKRNEDDWGWD